MMEEGALRVSEEQLTRNEAILQSVLSSVADGILAISNQRVVICTNRRFAEIWQIPQELIDSGSDKALLESVLNRLVDPMAFLVKVEALYDSDQEDMDTLHLVDGRCLERYSIPMMEHGAVTGRVWSFRDITDRLQAESELDHHRQELEALNRTLEERVKHAVADLRQMDQMLTQQSRQAAMGEMISHIAHQWRQPLTALRMVLGNLEDSWQMGDVPADEVREEFRTGGMLIQNMSQTISDFMNFFRSDKESEDFSLLTQVKNATALVAAGFAGANIRIQIEAPSDLKVTGFPNEFSQALLNLLINAQQAILGGGRPSGMIRIALSRSGPSAEVSVLDDAGGVPDEVIGRIFEPFFTTRESGSGIGLHMTRQIIEGSMGGKISVRNVGGGAEFTLLLPLARGGS